MKKSIIALCVLMFILSGCADKPSGESIKEAEKQLASMEQPKKPEPKEFGESAMFSDIDKSKYDIIGYRLEKKTLLINGRYEEYMCEFNEVTEYELGKDLRNVSTNEKYKSSIKVWESQLNGQIQTGDIAVVIFDKESGDIISINPTRDVH